MNFIKRNIPNAITCGNLLCGCLAIVKVFEGNLVWAAYLVGIAAVLDFFDGFAARLLKVSSPIGKDLDSLADMVTFGVVPGIIMFHMLKISIGIVDDAHFASPFLLQYVRDTQLLPYHYYLPYIAFIIPILSAVRLAKFNNDTRQSDSFIGVPTPANAIFISSIALLSAKAFNAVASDNFAMHVPIKEMGRAVDPAAFFADWTDNPSFLISITIVFSLLLVAELPLFSLKFKHFKWKGNEIRFIFLLAAIVLFALLQLIGVPLTIILYILLSVFSNIINKKKITSV